MGVTPQILDPIFKITLISHHLS